MDENTTLTTADFDRAYDYIRANRTRNDFLASLFAQFERKGFLSEKQVLAVLRGIKRDSERVVSADKADPVTECGIYRAEDGTVYRVKKSRESENLYALRFVPEATTKSERFVYARGAIYTLTAKNRLTVEEAEKLGAQYGVCCVCGAELTDAKSVARGIGPVCAKKV